MRLKQFDALRGIAAISVCFFHIVKYLKLEGTYFGKIFQFGNMGVDLFFIISGFVIYMSLKNTKNIKEFWISRFTRLYPTYWFSCLFTTIILFVFNDPRIIRDGIGKETILVNLTMVQNFFGYVDLDGAYWTLIIEFVFYFWISIFYFFIGDKINIILYFWLFFAFIYKIDHFNLPYELQVDKYFIVSKLPFFIFGISIFSINYDVENIINTKRNLNFALLFSSIFVILFFYFKEYGFSTPFFIMALVIIVFLILSEKTNKTKWENKSLRLLLFLGNISYPLYLIHGTLIWNLFVFLDHLNVKSNFLKISLTLPLVISISYVVHVFVEKAISKKIKLYLIK